MALMPARSGGLFLSRGVDAHPHRNALDDLDPIAAGILRGQQRKFLSRSRTDAFDRAVPGDVGIGIDRDGNRLARPHISELGLFRIGFNPGVIGIDKIKGRGRGGEIFSGRDRRNIGDQAGKRRGDDGVIELALRLVDLRLRLQVLRMLSRRGCRRCRRAGPVGLALADATIRVCSCPCRASIAPDRRWPEIRCRCAAASCRARNSFGPERPAPARRQRHSPCACNPASSHRWSARFAPDWLWRCRAQFGTAADRADRALGRRRTRSLSATSTVLDNAGNVGRDADLLGCPHRRRPSTSPCRR